MPCICMYVQSCLTLCDPMECSPPGPSVLRITQASILEWVAIPRDLPNPGIKPASPAACALADGFLPVRQYAKHIYTYQAIEASR